MGERNWGVKRGEGGPKVSREGERKRRRKRRRKEDEGEREGQEWTVRGEDWKKEKRRST